MKIKKFNYALLGLLAFGSLTASAQKAQNDKLEVGNYEYTVNENLGDKLTGTVTVSKVLDEDNFIQNGVLDFPGNITYQVGSKTYSYKVTKMATNLYKDIATSATSVVIPKELTEIPEGAFNTLSRLNSITFEAGSQVKKIANKAFASTMITEFDFSPCTVLEELDDNVFIDIDKPTTNTNTFITKVTLPTGPEFKHINAAFRNLPELTEIVNLKNSFVTEIVAKAFDGDKKLKTLNLPSEILWIDKAALEGSSIEALTVDVTNLLYLGGGSVELNANSTTMLDKYTFDDTYPATTNLYNKSDKTAPLKTLVLTGTLQGKIAKNAFLNCVGLMSEVETDEGEEADRLPFNLNQLYFGSQAQIQTDAFKGCTGITKLTINNIANNQLANNEYTIADKAFEGCNISELIIGDITTANAIGAEAFGKKLKNVTIGTVKAGTSVFKKGAFVWDNVGGTTLNLATGEGQQVFADSPNSDEPIIVGEVFNFSAVAANKTPLPVVTIGKIGSQGGVFAKKALNGRNIETLNFVGDINIDGLENAILGDDQDVVTTIKYEQATKEYDAIPSGGKELTGTLTYSLKDVGKYWKFPMTQKYWKIVGVKTTNDQAQSIDDVADNQRQYIYEQTDRLYDAAPANRTEYNPATQGATPEEGNYQKSGDKFKVITSVTTERNYVNALKTLVFNGSIQKNGIHENAFANLINLQKVEFNGELKEDALAAGSFKNSGLVGADGNIGSATAPFVSYTYADVRDYTVNPFNSESFGAENDERVIYWKVVNAKLSQNIAIGIHQAADSEYDGETVDVKFNVFKWIDILAEEEAALANTFLVFRNQNEPNVAWGRYDLGSFAVEWGKYYDPTQEDATTGENPTKYTATPMKIARQQVIDGAKTNITLYGIYTESDDNKKQSATYMVPLYSQDGYYYIGADNTELIIVKAEKTEGEFTEADLPVAYENTQINEVESLNTETREITMEEEEGDLEISTGTLATDEAPYSSVWAQLLRAKDYTKSDKTWTHEELIDEVERLIENTTDYEKKSVKGEDLWIMTDPGKYNGFRIDKNPVVRGNGAFIAKNWYYALLKKYEGDAAEARIIWLDEDQATAIFSVQNFNGSSVNGTIYNLQGVRVNGTQKGVYIQNGKKYIVK